MKTILVLVIIILGILGSYYYLNSDKKDINPTVSVDNSRETENASDVQVIASNLEIPWEIEFLPDKTFFVTERKGSVWQFNPDGSNKKKVLELKDVAHIGEGGLLGVANHPQHEKNGITYLYYTYEQNGLKNKVVRYRHTGDSLVQDKIIIDNIPGNKNHNGGRIKFGLDDKLYITTGDSEDPSSAQNTNSLAGKILRLNDDGSIPSDNPFRNAVYSYGHRNPQGLAWDASGRLWATEHGQTAFDEVNAINRGENYGWPEIKGDQTKEGMSPPYVHSGNSTWAPSGAIAKGDYLYFTGLRGQAIYTLYAGSAQDEKKQVSEYFKSKYGRIRSINFGPDRYFYILTNNRDRRGNPQQGDDKIIKIPLDALQYQINILQ